MYYAVLIIMKITITRDVLVEIVKSRLENEIWDHQFRRWDEIDVETLNEDAGDCVHLTTSEGDVIRWLPRNAFVIK